MSKKRKQRSKRQALASVPPGARQQDTGSSSKDAEDKPRQKHATPNRPAPLTTPSAAFLFGEVSAARPFLLLRATLLLLAFDCWIDLVPHGGRYGVGGFNVAHFSWLDAILPVPSPAFYVGNLVFTGVLAFAMALRPQRAGMVLLLLSYTLGWAMSMLDSYQHHYLISLVLFSMVFFPLPSARALFGGEGDRSPTTTLERLGGLAYAFGTYELIGAMVGLPTAIGALGLSPSLAFLIRGGALVFGLVGPGLLGQGARRRTSAWGYVSVSVTCSIVYFYTAVTKLSPDWRDGHALRRLGQSDAFLAVQSEAAEGLLFLPPLEAAEFWSLMAKGAIAVQLVSAFGFLLATRQDAKPQLRWLAPLLGLAPLSFHIGAETMGLEIGWFSYYMLLIVWVVFSPFAALESAAEALSWPFRAMSRPLDRAFGEGGTRLAASSVAASVLCAAALWRIDLPGSASAGLYVVAFTLLAVVLLVRRNEIARFRGIGVALVFASVACFVALTETSVRYDYYRFVGGDHRRRQEYPEALAAYEKANRYVVQPHCVFAGNEEVECFREESDARDLAMELGPEHRVQRVDRSAREAEMRQLVEAQGS